MIYYDDLPLSKDILAALNELKIDYCDLCIKVTLNGIHYQGMCLMA